MIEFLKIYLMAIGFSVVILLGIAAVLSIIDLIKGKELEVERHRRIMKKFDDRPFKKVEKSLAQQIKIAKQGRKK